MGFLPARALECYKESRNHVIINYLHIALLEQREAIVIIPLKIENMRCYGCRESLSYIYY